MKKRFSDEQIIGFLKEAETGIPLKSNVTATLHHQVGGSSPSRGAISDHQLMIPIRPYQGGHKADRAGHKIGSHWGYLSCPPPSSTGGPQT
jgi:hypothetical protein